MQAEKFLIIGNDKKMQACRDRLESRGFVAVCCDGDAAEKNIPFYENIVLPIPTLANGLITGTRMSVDELKGRLGGGQRVFYGNLKYNPFGEKSVSYYNESFLVKNSRLTAQGAFRLVLENIERDIYEIRAAVLGYGRCGRAICKLLKANGAEVVSVSRNAYSAALSENEKIPAIDYGEFFDKIGDFDVIVNTVPYNVLGDKSTERLTGGNLYIEIASKPYGFDITKTDKFNFRYILAESLPGRFAPVSAGANIADTVTEIIKEGKNE